MGRNLKASEDDDDDVYGSFGDFWAGVDERNNHLKSISKSKHYNKKSE